MQSSWRTIQRENFHSLPSLAYFLHWDSGWEDKVWTKAPFPLNLPLRLAKKIEKNSFQDPILRQFVPLQEEKQRSPTFVPDPVCDKHFQKEKKLLHKYHNRALLLTTSACAMHCRFCFRQNFPYETTSKLFEKELEWIAQNPHIEEVILSGGDPLSLENNTLALLLSQLQNIPHIQRIRFHTRFPIGIPERIDSEFLSLLSTCNKQCFFALHVNHPREMDADIFAALQSIQKLGIPVLSQTVLLQGINDDPQVLSTLYTHLSNHGILPYYLHQLDHVAGAESFACPPEKGKQIMQVLASQLSGYSVPRYVQEIPGKQSKTHIFFPML